MCVGAPQEAQDDAAPARGGGPRGNQYYAAHPEGRPGDMTEQELRVYVFALGYAVTGMALLFAA